MMNNYQHLQYCDKKCRQSQQYIELLEVNIAKLENDLIYRKIQLQQEKELLPKLQQILQDAKEQYEKNRNPLIYQTPENPAKE